MNTINHRQSKPGEQGNLERYGQGNAEQGKLGDVLNKVRRDTLNTFNHRHSKPGEQGNLERDGQDNSEQGNQGHSEQDDQGGYSEEGHCEQPTEHLLDIV
jgi:hypothetical protein